MNERCSPQKKDQLRRQEASPSQVVRAGSARTQERADQETGRDQRPGSQFVGACLNLATSKLPQAQNADSEEESEFKRIVDGQEDRIGDG